ncbi:MAG: flagellar motor switch protein FliN [Anaerolineaceae bacterium]|nr:flagellar motor switch protein FliN [Anaerolineaceae bacterium]
MADYEGFEEDSEMEENQNVNEELLMELNRQAQQKSGSQSFQDRPSMLDQNMPGMGGSSGFTPGMGMPGNNGRDNANPQNIDMLMDISLNVTVELGRTKMMLREVLELQHGSVVELDRLAGDAVDVFVNNRLIARGEVVVVDDKFGVRITELINKNGKKGAL